MTESLCGACRAEVYGTRFCESCGALQATSPVGKGLVASEDGVLAPDMAAKPTSSPRRRFTIVAICTLGLVAVAAAGVLVAISMAQTMLEETRTKYVETYSDYRDLVGQLESTQSEARELLESTAPEVLADPLLMDAVESALAALEARSLVTALEVEQESDGALIDELRAALESISDEIRAEIEVLSGAVSAAVESREVKAVSDARADLDAAIQEGTTVLAESEGRVEDESQRDALAEALETGRSLLKSEDAVVDDFVVAAADVRANIETVDAARTPEFTDVEGTWCFWNDASRCVTIDLPLVGTGSAIIPPVAGSRRTPSGDGWTYLSPGEPCFTTTLGAADGSAGVSLQFMYCPRGVSSSIQMVAFNNPAYERIYYAGEEMRSPYFRQSEWAAAVGR